MVSPPRLLQQAFLGSLSSDRTRQKESEQHIHQAAFPTALESLKLSLDELLLSTTLLFTTGECAALQDSLGCASVTANLVFLKNSLKKHLAAGKNAAQDDLAQQSTAAVADTLLSLTSAAARILFLVRGGDVRATFAPDGSSPLQRAGSAATSWLKILQEIANLLCEKTQLLPKDVVSTVQWFDQLLQNGPPASLLPADAAVQQMLLQPSDAAEQPPQHPVLVAVSWTTPRCAVLYACLLLAQAMLKSQKFIRMQKPALMQKLTESMLPALLRLGQATTQKLGEEASASKERVAFLWEVQRLVLKSYAAAVWKDTDASTNASLEQWLGLLHVLIGQACCGLDDDVRRENLSTTTTSYKASCQAASLKWALAIIGRFFSQPSGVSQLFKKQFSLKMTQTAMLTLNHPLPLRCCNLVLTVLAEASELGNCFQALKTELSIVMTKVCFPLLCWTDADQHSWQQDPEEFLRQQMDVLQAVNTPRHAAERFVRTLAKYRTDAALLPLLEFCVGRMGGSPQETSPTEIDGVLCVLGLLAGTMVVAEKRQDCSSGAAHSRPINVHDMIQNFILPFLAGPNIPPFLRCRALDTFSQYAVHEGAVSNEQLAHATKICIQTLLKEEDWICRVRAGINVRDLVLSAAGPSPGPTQSQTVELSKLLGGELSSSDQKILVGAILKLAQEFPCDELPESLSMLLAKCRFEVEVALALMFDVVDLLGRRKLWLSYSSTWWICWVGGDFVNGLVGEKLIPVPQLEKVTRDRVCVEFGRV